MMHPFSLAAKTVSADTPNWNEAINGPNKDGYWKACLKDIAMLLKMKVWNVVKREP